MGMGRKVWRVADSFAGSILEESRKNSGADAGTGGYIKDALELFKWVTIDVFGVVALGYDFQCTKSLKLAPLAQSFDYSIDDVQERTLASEMCNPFIFVKRERVPLIQKRFDDLLPILRVICNFVLSRLVSQAEAMIC